MELQQLRYVVALAETRSFTRAAEQCHVVQSALSHQIKAVERELGTALFVRNSRRVEITEAGERFVAHARDALAAVGRAGAVAIAGHVGGSLTLGMIPTVTALDVPALLGAFHRAHPHVHVALRGASSEQLIAAVQAGRVDAAFVGLPEDSGPARGIRMRELSRAAHVAVVSAQHRLATRRRLTLRDLADETFVDFTAASRGRAQSDLAFERAGLARSVVFEVSSPEMICGLVAQNLAVAFLPAAFVADRPGLVTLPVVGGPGRVEHLVWDDFNPSPAASAFLALVDAQLAAASAAGREG
ncbi:LysR substrate-binding domain-containing protein [Microbacterium sp. No. 7]|uniref:LysR substrate-binding domain-containing protein n=1 Tax=Microbacterium sp. No. 7 TaxID=1714373 RepID=UPI0009E82CB3|nr:LysR substrate-binding domain-containing protein [Microbacterium sp. No. 7]